MTRLPDFETFSAEVLGEPISPAWAVLFRGVDRLAPRNDAERAIWRSLYGRDSLPNVSPSQIVLVKGRRAGGTKTSCKRLVYKIHTGDYQRYVSKGERIHVIVQAQDRQTGSEIMSYFSLFYERPVLRREVIDVFRNQIVLKNGFVITVKTNSFRAPRGISCALGQLDETGVWATAGANLDLEVLRALTPAMVQFANREVHILGTPWVAEGMLHEASTNPFARADRAVFHCPTALMIKGQSNAAAIEQQLAIEKEADPQAYAREFECAWISDLSAFLSDADVRAARMNWRELAPADGIDYFMALDASALVGGDSFVAGGAHVANGVTVVNFLRGWRRGSVVETCDEIASLCRAYKIRRVVADQYSFIFLAELMRQRGIALEQLSFNARSKAEIYFDLKNSLAQGTFQIPDHGDALRELRSLESARTSGGGYRISARRGCHDDFVTVLALLAHKAKRSVSRDPVVSYISASRDPHDRFFHKIN